jgi:hypothetical protein
MTPYFETPYGGEQFVKIERLGIDDAGQDGDVISFRVVAFLQELHAEHVPLHLSG